MPPKTLLRLGLVFLLVASSIYFLTGRWLHSRIFTPLDYSVSLDHRQLQSPPFKINLRETYFTSLDLDYSADDWYQDNRCNYRTILYPHWRVYRLSSDTARPRKLWVSSDQLTHGDGSLSNAFVASPGQYQLEWDIPTAAPCLNPRHPQLLVFTDSSGYQEGVGLTQLLCVMLGGTGVALMVMACAARWKFARTVAPRIFPDMVLRNVMPIAKHTRPQVIHELPHWGLFCGTVLWILIFIFMIFGPLPSRGLFVSWRQPAVVWEKSPWSETLEVYVGPSARFFINGTEIKRSELRTKLLDQLGRRAEWTVYFEADSDTAFGNAVYALDTIQACGAKVVWVTPKMREEWQHNSKTN